MPKQLERPEVRQIADYLRERANQEIPRRFVGRALGIRPEQFSSLLTAIAEHYPQIGESDDNKLVWVEP